MTEVSVDGTRTFEDPTRLIFPARTVELCGECPSDEEIAAEGERRGTMKRFSEVEGGYAADPEGFLLVPTALGLWLQATDYGCTN